jgi:spoIIIJ-associated protein
MTQTHYAQVEEVLKTLLSSLQVEVEGVTQDFDEKMKTMRFHIASPDSRMLIGEGGDRLQSLNYLMKKIMEKKHAGEGAPPSFMVDVNKYQTKRIEELRVKAGMLAERARYFRTSMPLEPMSAFDRLIVHAEFTDTPDIRTESSGIGKDRHVVLFFDDKKNTPV